MNFQPRHHSYDLRKVASKATRMFPVLFDGPNPVVLLAACCYSRCGALGLTEADEATLAAARREVKYRSEFTICPYFYTRRLVCELVGEWPSMQAQEDRGRDLSKRRSGEPDTATRGNRGEHSLLRLLD